MGSFKSFEEIDAWQKARELTKKTYDLSKNGLFSKDFALRDQCRRASVSIMANIAEGFERGGSKEFLQFLSIAKSSSAEFRSHLFVALDQSYLSAEDFKEVTSQAEEIAKMISGLMRYLSKTEIKGTKYR